MKQCTKSIPKKGLGAQRIRNLIKLSRLHGQSMISQDMICPIVIEGDKVVSKVIKRNPVEQDDDSVIILGPFIKLVDTCHIEDDKKAGKVAIAELERLRGELNDPSLEVIQLADGKLAEYSSTFAIYKPNKKSGSI